MISKYAICLAFFWAGFINSSEETVAQPKKYQLAVASIFKDEALYLKLWIEYHLVVGVEHFYLYNNISTDDFMTILTPYIDQGIITLVDWPTRVPPDSTSLYPFSTYTQAAAYQHACETARQEAKWLGFIDIDEYLVPTKAASVQEVLAAYDEAPGVHVYWHIYGTANIQKLPVDTLMIEALHMVALPDNRMNTDVFKTILKPELFEKFSWPCHQCVYTNGKPGVKVGKDELRLNHYINRSVDYFYQTKLWRKQKNMNAKLSPEAIAWWAQLGNDIEDTERYIDRFIPALRQKMGYPSLANSTSVPVNLSQPSEMHKDVLG